MSWCLVLPALPMRAVLVLPVQAVLPDFDLRLRIGILISLFGMIHPKMDERNASRLRAVSTCMDKSLRACG